ncbi:hypothetical protein HF521_003203 [Silurus meridionalis]|uniref:THD domain-containing protein n=1 Tax=Silurus meridionalis TaxID=175797 RepID=A0A8T0B3Z1_SILME|nr:hypothetical protein HF521_003203 [Silurus meridionalis]
MHNPNYKFSFLVSWCFLLSISIVVMVTVIAKGSTRKETPKEEKNATGGGKYAYSKGYEQKSVDYIHLVWAGNDKSPWKQSTSCFCANTSLHLQNDSVIITTGGFYHTYAQVTFMSSGEHEGTVTLVANEKMPGKVPRKLSEAEHRYGTVSMSGVFRLRHGDSVKLNISRSPSVFFSKDASKTYWGLLLLKQ